MDFAGIVKISFKAIDVYPANYDEKPLVGQGLNKPAVITLFDVFPVNKTTFEPLKDDAHMSKYEEKVRVGLSVGFGVAHLLLLGGHFR